MSSFATLNNPIKGRLTSINLLLIALVAALLLVLSPAPAANAAVGDMPPQGVFDICAINTAEQIPGCVSRFDKMLAADQTIVYNGSLLSASLANIQIYAEAARVRGMKLMVPLSGYAPHHYGRYSNELLSSLPQFAAACTCFTNEGLLTYMESFFSSTDAHFGYYLVDDTGITTDTRTQLESFLSWWRPMVGSHGPMIGLYNWPNEVERFGDLPMMLGMERYLTFAEPPSPEHTYRIGVEVANPARRMQQFADANPLVQPSAILQAWSWSDHPDYVIPAECAQHSGTCRFPTSEEMLRIRDQQILNADTHVIMWWFWPSMVGFQTESDLAGWSNWHIPTDPAILNDRYTKFQAAATAPPPRPPLDPDPLDPDPLDPDPLQPKDTRSPLVALSGKRRQSIRRRYLSVAVRPDEAVRLLATGRVLRRAWPAPRASIAAHTVRFNTYRLIRAKATARAGQKVALRLRLSRRALRAARHSLRHGRRPAAKITVVATDAAGNKRTVRRRITITR
jgi:hypothetical protein